MNGQLIISTENPCQCQFGGVCICCSLASKSSASAKSRLAKVTRGGPSISSLNSTNECIDNSGKTLQLPSILNMLQSIDIQAQQCGNHPVTLNGLQGSADITEDGVLSALLQLQSHATCYVQPVFKSGSCCGKLSTHSLPPSSCSCGVSGSCSCS